MPEPRLNCARMAARFCLRMWITMKLRIILAALTLTPALWAYQSSETANLPSAPSQTQVSKDSDPVTVLPQHQWKRFWFSGQMNIIEQGGWVSLPLQRSSGSAIGCERHGIRPRRGQRRRYQQFQWRDLLTSTWSEFLGRARR